MLLKFISRLKFSVLSVLPVPLARKYLERFSAPLTSTKQPRQLLVDVSVIINSDARTGVQRVVRALLLQLLESPPADCIVRPVFATSKHGYHYAPDNFSFAGTQIADLSHTFAVSVRSGDIFLGLDLAAHIMPRHKTELAGWKYSGVKFYFVVYDLLPIINPEWFNPKTKQHFCRWLKTTVIFVDGYVCISDVVKSDLTGWLMKQYALSEDVSLAAIPLGCDIKSSAPSYGLPDNIDMLMRQIFANPTILMVGTIEPRKGHEDVLAAFEKLWEQGCNLNLIIIGKAGWKTKNLQQALRTHNQNQKHLFWFDNASDELLEIFYTKCMGVIIASKAEGFGLPLVEALYHAKPILARDIPIFREIGEDYVTFFPDAENLAKDIGLWLENMKHTQTSRASFSAWKDSAQALLHCLGLESSGA